MLSLAAGHCSLSLRRRRLLPATVRQACPSPLTPRGLLGCWPPAGVTYESVREEMRAQLTRSKADKLNDAKSTLAEKELEYVKRHYEVGKRGK